MKFSWYLNEKTIFNYKFSEKRRKKYENFLFAKLFTKLSWALSESSVFYYVAPSWQVLLKSNYVPSKICFKCVSFNIYYFSVAKTDYINASLVEVPEVKRKYILTQGPLGNTVDHFWSMVWEQVKQDPERTCLLK